MTGQLGVVFYRGPSLLTDELIVGVISGLDEGSMNKKTGPIAQAWILVPDEPPMEAVRAGRDAAICGDCALRGDAGHNRKCYVHPWLAANQVWKQVRDGVYPDVDWPDLAAVLEGRYLRLGAYGDPAAIPFDVWRQALTLADGWVGYTHQWRRCDARFQTLTMASVDTAAECDEARAAGWRTFRVRPFDTPLLAEEIVCPASEEAGFKTTCQACQLCRGTATPARSIAIHPHGTIGTLKAHGLDVRGAGGRGRAGTIIPLLRSHDHGEPYTPVRHFTRADLRGRRGNRRAVSARGDQHPQPRADRLRP